MFEMKNICILLVILELPCDFALSLIVPQWVVASDFKPQELSNLTLEQEHDLFLKTLTQENRYANREVFLQELMANSIDNTFYGLTNEENSYREHVAIAKAAFEYFTKIQNQDRFIDLAFSAFMRGTKFSTETRNLSEAYSHVCSQIDDSLKTESFYASKKDEYKRNTQLPPKKIYQYGIPKSHDELIKTFAEFYNHPRIKKLRLHMMYRPFFLYEAGFAEVNRNAILELAKLPNKLEPVQKIYDKSIDEVALLMQNVKRYEDFLSLFYVTDKVWKQMLMDKLLSKIRENPDLKNNFEKIPKIIPDYGDPWIYCDGHPIDICKEIFEKKNKV